MKRKQLHNQTDSQGRKQGYWEETDKYGYIEKGHYVDDLRQGLWKGYYKDGTLYFEGHYVDGLRQGLWKDYHKDGGTIYLEGHHHNDKKHGLWKSYLYDGTLKSCILYNRNQKLFSPPLLFLPSWLNLL